MERLKFCTCVSIIKRPKSEPTVFNERVFFFATWPTRHNIKPQSKPSFILSHTPLKPWNFVWAVMKRNASSVDALVWLVLSFVWITRGSVLLWRVERGHTGGAEGERASALFSSCCTERPRRGTFWKAFRGKAVWPLVMTFSWTLKCSRLQFINFRLIWYLLALWSKWQP